MRQDKDFDFGTLSWESNPMKTPQQGDPLLYRRYTPEMMKSSKLLRLALAGAAAIAVVIYLALFWIITRGATSIEVLRITFTILAGFGAVFAGVYAYRRQQLQEGDSLRADGASFRADENQFTSRCNSTAEQLGSAQAAIRLAGVYAMASRPAS